MSHSIRCGDFGPTWTYGIGRAFCSSQPRFTLTDSLMAISKTSAVTYIHLSRVFVNDASATEPVGAASWKTGNLHPRIGEKKLLGNKNARYEERETWKSRTGRNVKKRYGSKIDSILEAMRSNPDLEEALEPWRDKLQAKEQSILLNVEKSWERALSLFTWLKKQRNYEPNIYFYNILLKILGRAQQWSLLEQFLEEMEELEIPLTNISYSTLIDIYSKAGCQERAVFWAEHMKGRGLIPDHTTLTTVINSHKRFGNITAAEEAFESFSVGVQSGANLDAYNSMISLYGQAGRYSDSWRVFAEMRDAGVEPDTVTYNTMIQVCGLAGQVHEAEMLFHRMKDENVTQDVVTFNTVIAVFVKHGDMQLASDYFVTMNASGYVTPDVVTYETLVSALAARGIVNKVETMLLEMKDMGVFVGNVLSVTIFRMYVRKGLAEHATRFLKDSVDLGWLNSGSIAGIIDAYADIGSWQEAEDVFLVCKNRWNVETCNVMIKAYGRGNEHLKAWELFKLMEEERISTDEVTLNTVVQILASKFPVDVPKIEEVWNEFYKTGFKPLGSTFVTLIILYGRLGNVHKSEKVFQSMVGLGVAPDIVSYGALANVYAEAGLVKETENLLLSMQRAGFSSNRVIGTTMMKLYRKVGSFEKVEKSFLTMQKTSDGLDYVAVAMMIDLYGKLGRRKDAEKLFDTVDTVGYCGLSETLLTAKLNLYRNLRMFEKALEIAGQILKMEDLRDIRSVNSILALFASLGKVGEAAKVFDSLSARRLIPTMLTCTVVARMYKQAGLFVDAIDIFNSPVSLGLSHTLQSLTLLISLYSKAGMVEESLNACARLRSSGLTLDIGAYNVMIFAFGTAGRLDESLDLFSEVQKVGLTPDVVTYTTVINVYGWAGSIEGVTRIFKRMKQAMCVPNMATYNAIIDIYRKAGKEELAAMVTQEKKFSQYIKQQSRHNIAGLTEHDGCGD